MNNKKKIIILATCMFLLSGCTKTLKDEDKNIVKNIKNKWQTSGKYDIL